MPFFQNQAYLASVQYKDAGNLNARIQLHERFSTNPYGWFRWVFDHFDLPSEAHILEVGCGSGKLWSENLARIPPSWHVVLSDYSPGMVAGCQGSFSATLSHFSFEIADAMAIPFLGETFDAIIANHMIYHLPDRRRAISEIARILKPEGVFFAATNGEKHLLELDELILQNLPLNIGGLIPTKWIKNFTLENGSAQLSQWFRQVEVHQYEDALDVTEAEPLLAYIHSMIPRIGNLPGMARESRLGKTVKNLIQREGCIHIQKSSGMFIARK